MKQTARSGPVCCCLGLWHITLPSLSLHLLEICSISKSFCMFHYVLSSIRIISHLSRLGDQRLEPIHHSKTDFIPLSHPMSIHMSDGVKSQDLISRLPVELSDLIFSELPPTSLDAARYTCHEWWRRIMTRSGVLSTVIGPDPGATRVVSSSTQAPVSATDQPED